MQFNGKSHQYIRYVWLTWSIVQRRPVSTLATRPCVPTGFPLVSKRTPSAQGGASLVDLVEHAVNLVPQHITKDSSVALAEAMSDEHPLSIPQSSRSVLEECHMTPLRHKRGGGDPKKCEGAMKSRELQQKTLRTWFTEAHNGLNTVKMRKAIKVFKSERRAFYQAHGRRPSEREVSRYVDIELAPVAALKTMAASAAPMQSAAAPGSIPLSSVPSTLQVQEALLLQQHARQHQLAQVGGKTWLRCLRCFHTFFANPKNLLCNENGPVQLSWISKERYKRMPCGDAVPLSKSKRQQQVTSRMRARTEIPNECPRCGARKVQWMLEYIHSRTHSSL